MPALHLPVRYQRTCADPGVPTEESNFELTTLEHDYPVEQTALVLVDCWDSHYIKSHERLTGEIMRKTLKPVIEALRGAGMTIVHAPSPPQAKKYAAWTHFAGPDELGLSSSSPAADWPPEEFRKREGDHAQFAKLKEPVLQEYYQVMDQRRILPDIEPVEGDFVVATGEQLHRLLRHREIVHLLYAGFATNMCILYRDYGTRAMGARGYNVVLIRDCTLGIEGRETFEESRLTQAAIRMIEQQTGFSTTSGAVLTACQGLL